MDTDTDRDRSDATELEELIRESNSALDQRAPLPSRDRKGRLQLDGTVLRVHCSTPHYGKAWGHVLFQSAWIEDPSRAVEKIPWNSNSRANTLTIEVDEGGAPKAIVCDHGDRWEPDEVGWLALIEAWRTVPPKGRYVHVTTDQLRIISDQLNEDRQWLREWLRERGPNAPPAVVWDVIRRLDRLTL